MVSNISSCMTFYIIFPIDLILFGFALTFVQKKMLLLSFSLVCGENLKFISCQYSDTVKITKYSIEDTYFGQWNKESVYRVRKCEDVLLKLKIKIQILVLFLLWIQLLLKNTIAFGLISHNFRIMIMLISHPHKVQ